MRPRAGDGDRRQKNPHRPVRGRWGLYEIIFYGVHLIPNSLPTFLCRPAFVVGIPVAFTILRFALVIPRARFQLKESPGILKEDFLAISNYAPS